MTVWLVLILLIVAVFGGANAAAFLQPAKNRNPKALHPEFLGRLERWLAAARVAFPHLEFSIGEGRRTLTRQRWLFGVGRTHTLKSRVVTWTLLSMHRWGLAADIVIVRKTARGVAIWDTSVWQHVFAVIPPSKFGLESLVPTEWNHLQIVDANSVVARQSLKGLTQT
ncbi:MAG: M15 family metallopeptidase [Pleurocapsa sp. SU_196_0]|nr:M15 family metallopeptidase [Pleurocapsa sp. SU_196_0]